jgi:hypothetical protein
MNLFLLQRESSAFICKVADPQVLERLNGNKQPGLDDILR